MITAPSPRNSIQAMALRFSWPESLWEAFSALASGWWAYLLWIPGAHLFSTQASFSGLSASASEGVWGMLCAAVCFLHIAGIISHLAVIRASGLTLAAFTWFAIATRIGLVSPLINHLPFNTGWGVYSIIGLFCVVHIALIGRHSFGRFYEAWDQFLIAIRPHKRQETQ